LLEIACYVNNTFLLLDPSPTAKYEPMNKREILHTVATANFFSFF